MQFGCPGNNPEEMIFTLIFVETMEKQENIVKKKYKRKLFFGISIFDFLDFFTWWSSQGLLAPCRKTKQTLNF
jgi:hypothetical protein